MFPFDEITTLIYATQEWEIANTAGNHKDMIRAHKKAETIRNKYRENGERGSDNGNTGVGHYFYHTDYWLGDNMIITGGGPNPIIHFSVEVGVGLEAHINLNGAGATVGGKMYYDLTNVASNSPTQSMSFSAEAGVNDRLSVGGSVTCTINPETKKHLRNEGYAGIKIGNTVLGWDQLNQKRDFHISLSAGVYFGVGGAVSLDINASEFIRRIYN